MKKYCIINKQVLVNPVSEVCAGCVAIENCNHKNHCLTQRENERIEATDHAEFLDLDVDVVQEVAAAVIGETEENATENQEPEKFEGGGGEFGGAGASGNFEGETTEEQTDDTTEDENTDDTQEDNEGTDDTGSDFEEN
jgi:hypothetical protein